MENEYSAHCFQSVALKFVEEYFVTRSYAKERILLDLSLFCVVSSHCSREKKRR